ncbi:hypothetical protein [Chitinophaga sp. OAE865]|uniref:hypothetical protein n=1 Tax=Chitinophaga sp. OAE865 TaxID=2817898 RepID=UPI001AE1BD0A
MKTFCILILLSCFGRIMVTAQNKETMYQAEFDTLAKKTIRNFRIPRDVAESCKSSVIAFIIRIDRKLNKNIAIKKEIQFSKNFPIELKNDILNNLVILESIKWEKLFPSIKSSGTYSFLVPMVYYLSTDCNERINSGEFADIVNAGLSFDEYPQHSLFFLKPLVISISKPIP